jgi:DNA-binding MarR family transcriptional regulator
MPPTRKQGVLPGMKLAAEEQRAWLAYMRIYLRMTYEMNRQLQSDSDISLADYHVLNALLRARRHTLRIEPLAAVIGWERSRVSHQVRRMSRRGLVRCEVSSSDRRATEVSLTPEGRRATARATPGHADLVRRLFFDELPPELLRPLTEALETIYGSVLKNGTLPPPESLG